MIIEKEGIFNEDTDYLEATSNFRYFSSSVDVDYNVGLLGHPVDLYICCEIGNIVL